MFTFIPDATNTSEVFSGTAGTIAANLQGSVTGNATTATALATARTIAISGDGTGTATSFNGSANITVPFTLATTGVTAGTYKSVTVDAKGRVTAATNPTTLAGFGITDAQPLDAELTAFAGLSTYGMVALTAAGTATTRSVAVSGAGLSVTNADGIAGNPTITSNATSSNTASTIVARDATGNFTAGTITATLSGNATTATTLATTRNITVSGDATATATFNGSADAALTMTLASTGITAGTYGNMSVDAKGRVTAIAAPTDVRDFGILVLDCRG
jgi:phage-related tail fiber protein